MKKSKIKLYPPGYKPCVEWIILCVALLIMGITNASFMEKFRKAISLFNRDIYSGGNGLVITIPDIHILVVELDMVLMVVIGMVMLMVLRNERAFRNGCKTVYLMKRVPNHWEMTFQCWAIPIIMLLITILLYCVLLQTDVKVWNQLIPKSTLNDVQYLKPTTFWRLKFYD
mgnify:CR=1 FL=1